MSVIIHDPLRFPFEAELQLSPCVHVCAYGCVCVCVTYIIEFLKFTFAHVIFDLLLIDLVALNRVSVQV